MGYTNYSARSYDNYSTRVENKTRHEVFSQRECHQMMNPNGLGIRECRDSEIHPDTVPIIIAMDVTGSMGYIPEQIIKKDLGKIVGGLIDAGIKDPTICFIAIGDHISDIAPLQVGQFESGDQELVQWLERTWLEGHGGGGNHESYNLAWLFASKHVVTDAWEKRKRRGFLFTIGDERGYHKLEGESLHQIMGYKQANDITAEELLKETEEKWNIFHLHVNDASYKVEDTQEFWRPLLGQSFINVPNHKDLPSVIGRLILETEPDSAPSITGGNDTSTKDTLPEIEDELL